MEEIHGVGVKRSRCHPKWRQIGSCESVNFRNSTRCWDPEVPPEVGETLDEIATLISSSPSSFGGMRILTAMNWATMRIQLLTFLPQLYPLLAGGKMGDKLVRIGMDDSETEMHQFLRDLEILTDWPYSKKRWDSEFAGRVLPTVELDEQDHDKDEKDQGGMSCQSKSYKKLWLILKRDKFQRQFLRELLATGRATIVANAMAISAAGSWGGVDVDGDVVTDTRIDSNTGEDVVVPCGGKISVVKLLRLGLKSRYASHLRKSMRDRDVQATICLLSIIANTDTVEEVAGHEFKESGPDDKNKEEAFGEGNKNVLENNTDPTSNNVNFEWHYVPDDVTSPHDQISELENYKLVLSRAFQFLQKRPEMLINLCKIMNNTGIKVPDPVTTTLRPQSLNEFLKEVKRLRNFVMKHLRLLEIKEIHSNSNQDAEGEWLTSASLYGKVKFSNRIQELEKALSTQKLNWDNISTEKDLEIKMLQEKLLHTKEEAEQKVLEMVKRFETENMIQAKAHKIRLEKFEKHADTTEERLFQAVLTLDGGYRGLRSYRKNKEAELQKANSDYNRALEKQHHDYKELFKQVKANDKEMKRLDTVQLSMQDTYEEMKTTKRLRELLQNLQMAESVKENWAARRIQTAWKRYKARKLRKRRIKKPRKKRKEEKSSSGGIGGMLFGLVSQPKTVAERRKPTKMPKP